MDVLFPGFVKKMVTPPQWPPNSDFFNYKSRFSLKTRINLGVSALEIRSQIGNSPWPFQIFWLEI